MKAYDFRCLNPSCKYVFEEWVEHKDEQVTCPMCDGIKNEVVFIHAPMTNRNKQPFDYIRHNDDPPIKSFVPKTFKAKRKAPE